jgi:hypothetical protein
MIFMYKTKKLVNTSGETIISVELYDFILGTVHRFRFDDEKFVDVGQHIGHILKDVKINYGIKKID